MNKALSVEACYGSGSEVSNSPFAASNPWEGTRTQNTRMCLFFVDVLASRYV